MLKGIFTHLFIINLDVEWTTIKIKKEWLLCVKKK